ncbi:putative TetR family transcriptional regulator [Caenibius tardaugens NBRC 16725]|uniref:Putative TetR family transcriptional regulator n=1 Tax=Caenibius tardaugens NBRC 16725 TaxID=1219035 RepID=U2YNT8_9SPHN|nr:TetR/AcrR family transcriptional regulator [Caenibius tardaugens]AZI35382.1 TetR/AcrR family transcriptional regulator [Caenibius tardaugens NBRC 16725]GAD50535.1 putative TetR family transcriptional regulator [Caenibius tardaugens NBRC 16725]
MARTQAADYEERKEAILAHASSLFAERGFLGTSVMDIALACGASKSLLYHYYPSKEDVLFDVMTSHVDLLLDDVDTVLALDLPPGESLHTVLHYFMRHYVGASDRQKVLLNELENLPADKRQEIVATQRKIVDAVQTLLVAALPEHCADPVEARGRTMLLFGMINWTGNWFDPTGKLTYQQIADMAYEMVLSGTVAPTKG